MDDSRESRKRRKNSDAPQLPVEKVIPDPLMKNSPLGRPQETPPSRARLAFPGSPPAASSGGYFFHGQPASPLVGAARKAALGGDAVARFCLFPVDFVWAGALRPLGRMDAA